MATFLGLDTSNYTTSVAVFDGADGVNEGRLLDVPPGTLGLRQSDALFQHVKRLPDLFAQLGAAGRLGDISAVAASTRPRAVDGSYMPCFLAGEGQGRAIAATLGVPFFAVSHQQGHLAAAAWSAGQIELLDAPLLAWHLSGGTTELLSVTPQGQNVTATRIGGTSDISAGQLIDRTGVLLGLDFPAGKALDALAAEADEAVPFAVKVTDGTFSLSGVENQVQLRKNAGMPAAEIARFVLETVALAVQKATRQAQRSHPGLPLLCSGGVASNRLLRAHLTAACAAIFAAPRYSADNAMGVAILACRAQRGGDVA